ncbi:MAG: hypothetical protein KDD38_11015 [Bdellovibrionales bacterium]|nr:hypothetical protein [Bdellovibrionales bacterium]
MVLVYQAYGREDILRQTQFSMVSLLSVLDKGSPLKIWVYTDNVKLFSDYFSNELKGDQPRVKIIEIKASQIQKWRGAIDFVHRVKVEILKDAAAQFNGPLYYVDGDTYFRHDPTALFSGVSDKVSLMHVAENALDEGKDPLSKKIAKFVKKNKFSLDGKEIQIPCSTVMYNAGAIGISQQNKSLLPLVIDLTDQTYSRYSKHIMEQLAFSYILQTRTSIITGDSIIGHYWSQKPEYQAAIDQFLAINKNMESAKAAYPNFIWPEPIKPKVKKSIWARFFQ